MTLRLGNTSNHLACRVDIREIQSVNFWLTGCGGVRQQFFLTEFTPLASPFPRIGHFLATSALVSVVTLSANAQAQVTNLQAIFVVDESGSMGGEQTFLGSFVPALDAELAALGIAGSYGLVGYGDSSTVARKVLVGGGDFGTPGQFTAASGTLSTSGSTEDGYDGITFALTNYFFATGPGTQRIVVLVTDEDRDEFDATDSLTSVQALLLSNGATLSGILGQEITDQAGTDAIGASQTQTFIDANGDGIPEASTAPILGTAAGTTTVDYTNPILSGGGCVANLNLLRLGGTAADAFARVLQRCLVQLIVAPPSTGGTEPFLTAAASNAALLPQRHFDDLSMRLTGRLSGLDDIAGAGLGGSSSGTQGPTANGLSINGGLGGVSVQAAAAEGEFGGLKFFVNAGGNFTNADGDGGQPGYDQKAGHVTAGMDVDIGSSSLAGLAFGYTSASAEADDDLAEMDQMMYALTAYAATKLGETGWVNAAAMVARNDYDFSRKAGGNAFTADTEGLLFSANLEAGADFAMGDSGFVVTPSAGMRFVDLSIDGYTEDQAGGQTVSKQDYDSVTATAKLKFAKFINTESGTLVPELSLGASYDVDAAGDSVLFTTGGGAPVIANINGPDRFSFTVSPGLGFVTAGGGQAFRLDYTATINTDYVDHAVSGRFRMRL